MESPFPDGGPAVSYTNALPPGSGQQSHCVLAVSETNPLYTLCPALHGQRQHQPETGSLPQGADDPSKQHHTLQVRGSDSHDPMTYYRPLQPRTQNLWLSPALNSKNLGRIALQDPISTPGTDALHYHPSPTSSGTWPSPAQPFPQSIDLVHQHNHQECLQICTPTSVNDYQMSDCEAKSYTSGVPPGYDCTSNTLQPHQPSPVSLDGSYSPAPLPLVVESTEMDSFKMDPSPGRAYRNMSVSRESSEAPKRAGLKGVAKKDEPYAKLIEKALRSRPDHAMQLQEIYQWFVENTDKTRAYQAQSKESKGWQNSIRHNLSMNAVSGNLPALSC